VSCSSIRLLRRKKSATRAQQPNAGLENHALKSLISLVEREGLEPSTPPPSGCKGSKGREFRDLAPALRRICPFVGCNTGTYRIRPRTFRQAADQACPHARVPEFGDQPIKTPDKKRPVLVLSRDSAISVLNSVTIAPITSTIRSIPTELVLTEEDKTAPHVRGQLR